MKVGDLVYWGGKVLLEHSGESLHGVVIDVGTDTDYDWFRVHWFEDNEEYNYRMDDTDILLVKK